MRRNEILFLTLIAAALLSSCAKQDATPPAAADLPHATVVMRDGTRVAGAIAATSATEITVNPDSGGSRTIPMKDVRRVNYGETATARPASSPQSQPVPPPPSMPEPTHEDHYHPAAEAVQSRTRILPAGAELPVRNEETIDSGKAVEGQTYAAEIAADVRDADGAVLIPRGSNAQLVIKSTTKGGRFRGSSDLILDLLSVSIDGQQYRLDTSDISEKGRSGVGANRRTGEMVGGGAALGAIIGAIAGGGKGAAIGAGSGAGAGALTQILTKGSIKVPAETVLTFKLDAPLKVVEAR